MDWFGCCSSVACGDCCSSIAGCDCCSISCCSDCFGAGSFFDGLKDWIENNVTIMGGSDYVLPTATESVKGGVKVGHSLKMNGENNEVMNVALDTISSTVEGFIWINDVTESVSGGS